MLDKDNGDCKLWDYVEIPLESDFTGNPFLDISLKGVFTKDDQEISVLGFYDGDHTWKIRFMPPETGEWHYVTESSWEPLAGHRGVLRCTEAETGVHGPVRARDDCHFAYADASPYYPVGTTCYVWNHQGEMLEQKTLESLKNAPFNKIRFCVFPKRYTFNRNEPPLYPFPGSVKEEWDPKNLDDYTPRQKDFWDWNFFNPAYFQHLDACVLQLRDLGIEADLILFHPYDFGAWGFDTLPEEVNTRLLRYLVARLGAFRNIWWSFANEYDFVKNKTMEEWDQYIQLVQKLDPYEHLRSIHNAHMFYDHKKPWITHCSIQSSDFFRIPEWSKQYAKPLVIDECCYEGNIDRDWGNISGKEMVHRFWQGFSVGAFVGHGETYMHEEDVLWWSKGGELHGTSSPRIAFLKDIVEQFPEEYRRFEGGEGFMKKAGDAAGGGVFPEFALYYFGLHQPSFRWIDFPEEGEWQIEVIDTWNMTIQSAGEHFSGRSRVELPGKEKIAIRIRKK